MVLEHLERIGEGNTPNIERIQDAVLYVLRESGNYDVAMAYARYRDARERSRRERILAGENRSKERINLEVICRDGRSRPWSKEFLERSVQRDFQVSSKVAHDIRQEVESHLQRSDATEIDSHLLLSLIETSLVRHGLTKTAMNHSALRINRSLLIVLVTTRVMAVKCSRSVAAKFSVITVFTHSAHRIAPHVHEWPTLGRWS